MNHILSRHAVKLLLMSLWALCFTKVVKAATLTEFMGAYDSQLLQWAAATAVLGGLIRTILSLESDDRVVKDIFKTALADAFKALIAGLFMFLAVQALRSVGWAIPSEIRFTAVLIAGWQRMAAVTWLFAGMLEIVNAMKAKFIDAPKKENP